MIGTFLKIIFNPIYMLTIAGPHESLLKEKLFVKIASPYFMFFSNLKKFNMHVFNFFQKKIFCGLNDIKIFVGHPPCRVPFHYHIHKLTVY